MQKDKHTGGPNPAFAQRLPYYPQQTPEGHRRYQRGEVSYQGPPGGPMRAIAQPPHHPPPSATPPGGQQQGVPQMFQPQPQRGARFPGTTQINPRYAQRQPHIYPTQQMLSYPHLVQMQYQQAPGPPVFSNVVFPAQYPVQYPGNPQQYYLRPPNLPARPSQGHVPNQPPGVPAHQPMPVMNPPVPKEVKKRSHAIAIVDPNSGEDILQSLLSEQSAEPRSGESSARETPQRSGEVVAEFARKVASVANEDGQQPASRVSNFSESENPVEPEPLVHASGIASPKLIAREIAAVEEPPLPPVESNIYPEIPMQAWSQPIPVPTEPPYLGMPMMLLPDGPTREFVSSHMAPSWQPQPDQPPNMCPPMGPPGVPVMPPNVVPPPPLVNKSAVTPVVSALAQGPPVDLGQFPALGPQRHGGHPSPGRAKRKPRMDQEQPTGVDSRPQPVVERTLSPVQVPRIIAQPALDEQPFKIPSPAPVPEVAAQPLPPRQSPTPQPVVLAKQEVESTPKEVATPCVETAASTLNSKNETAKKPEQPANLHQQTSKKPEQSVPSRPEPKKPEPPAPSKQESQSSKKLESAAPSRREGSASRKNDAPASIRHEPASKKSESATASRHESSTAKKPEVSRPETAAIKKPETPATGKPDVAAAAEVPAPAPSGPAKSSQVAEQAPAHPVHESKKKSKKNRQEHRQATPPPPSGAQPVVKPVPVEPPVMPAAPVVVTAAVEVEKLEPTTAPAAVQPEPEKMEPTKIETEEDALVAAKNAENAKLLAVQANEVAKESDSPNELNVINNNNIVNTNEVNNGNVIVENNNVNDNNAAPPNEAAPAVLQLRQGYKEGQWSPLNQTGLKRYERDFIMMLMNDPKSQKRPLNLPDLEALKDSRGGGGGGGGGGRDHNMRGNMSLHRHNMDAMMPSFGGKSSSMRAGGGGGGGGGGSGRSSMKMSSQMGNKLMKGGANNKSQAPIQVSLSLSEDVHLRTCDAPFIPSKKLNKTANPTDNDTKTDANIEKEVLSVLNKLTPEKFDTLADRVKKLPIDTVARLKIIINLVFEKAVGESVFCSLYAGLCKELEGRTVPDDDKPAGPDGVKPTINFRALLLYKCQQEFEKEMFADIDTDSRQQKIEAEEDPAKKKHLQDVLEFDQVRARKKAVGNVRLVGELFIKKMITAQVMHTCIQQLLRANKEECLECLCNLLRTIGQQLDETIQAFKAQARANAIKEKRNPDAAEKEVRTLDEYFNQLRRIMIANSDPATRTISLRTKFMVQNILELRTNRWVERREFDKPKTMDQVVRDAEREQLESNMALNAPQDRRGGGGGRQDSRHNMGGKQDNMGNNWNVASSGRHNKLSVDSSKIRLGQNEVQNEFNDNNISLGSRNQFQWQFGSKGDNRKQTPPAPMYTGLNITQNKFSILESADKPVSRGSSLKGGLPANETRLGPDRPRGYQSSTQDDSRNARNSSQPGPDHGSRANSRDPMPPTTAVSQTPSPATTASLSENENQRLTQNLLEEFLSLLDFEEAARNLSERFTTDVDKEQLVYNMLVVCVDKNLAARRGAGRLLSDFIKTSGITHQHFLTGLEKFLELAEDIVPDAPKLWEYLAEETIDVVSDGLGFAPLLEALKKCPVMASLGPEGPRTTVATLLRLIHTERPKTAILQSSISRVQEFVGDFETFVQKHSLQFLLEQPSDEPVAFDFTKTNDDLLRLLKRKTNFNQIVDWVSCNVGNAVTEPAFVYALTSAVLEFGATRKGDNVKLDLDIIKSQLRLLNRFVDNKKSHEIYVLYALQAKANEWQHPRGALTDICQMFADGNVCSSNGFNEWRRCKNSQYAEGKGVCMKTLTSFFTLLNEDEDSDKGSGKSSDNDS